MRSTNSLKAKMKRVNSPSVRTVHPEEVLQKMSFSQYDEEPTIIFLASNRDSLNSASYRPSTKGHSLQKRQSRLVTYESNLMESSQDRSESSAVDGEFVCKYLTPIKKQQFQRLLFQDEINQNLQNQKTKPNKPFKNPAKSKIHKSNALNQPQRSMTTGKHKNIMQSNMVKSFLPCGPIHQTDQHTESQIKDKNTFDPKFKQISSATQIPSTQSIFIDPNAQIYFLKSNNNELYKKLHAQIQKNQNLEQRIQQILNENKLLFEKNQMQQNTINHLKQVIIKFEDERRKYLTKEWQEFQLVKNLLIEKRKSRSKEPKQKDSISKSGNSNTKDHFFKKDQYAILQKKKEGGPKINVLEQIPCLIRDNGDSFGRDFSSGKMSLSHKRNTIQSETEKNDKSAGKKQRKMSFENNQQLKGQPKKVKDRGQVERILENKLFISEQNRGKKSVQSSPSRKTCKKNGSGPKQNFESGSRQLKR